jgi:hypothetical protein
MLLLKGATTAMISRKAASPLLAALGQRKSSLMVVGRTFHTPALGSRVIYPSIQGLLVPGFGEKRTFSTNVAVDNDGANRRILGTVTRTLQQLDSSVVMKIEEELKEVDKDADGL